ncbi:BON domain-containing protein [Paracoccus beibuensis]|uniref:BON domain-containing protein n=1 Tax=Paracoccus beibuensis TaxID=547602 RepID=UPI00224099D5|nr:BON domain-containing protein [Paracoccus beibuensis]
MADRNRWRRDTASGWSRDEAEEDADRRRFDDEQRFGAGAERSDMEHRPDSAVYGRDADPRYGGNRYGVGNLGFGMADYPYRRDPSPRRHGYGHDRDFLDRAGDEVASWFGDKDARRRRDSDEDHSGRGPKNYRRSDERILEDVNDRLTVDRHIDASDIEVSVAGGEVTLDGTVRERIAKRHAEDLAEMVSGVTHVQNNLRIAGASTSERMG